jgi:2-polyprenyl-3-methyl-5-hydroxy-6-metoxy-1,4-benzoquinol methylase
VKAVQGNGVQMTQANKYTFDNTGRRAEARYRRLLRLYDANTIRHIEQRGIERGWSCLEIGGGGGSIASWLCARVGDTGRVLATDIDPLLLQSWSYKNLEVWRHDIRTEGLPREEFHLAHARLVLLHLPDRQVAIGRMIDAVKPGGWVFVEEFDALTFLPEPAVNPGEAKLRELKANGLVQVGVEATGSFWGGKSARTELMKLNFEEMHEPMISSGLISQEEFEAGLRRIGEQDFLLPSPIMWTAWGRKPGFQAKPPAASDDFIPW